MFDIFFKKSPPVQPKNARHLVVKILDEDHVAQDEQVVPVIEAVLQKKVAPNSVKEIVAPENDALQWEFLSALEKIENISEKEFNERYAGRVKNQVEVDYYRIIRHFADIIPSHSHEAVDSVTPQDKKWWRSALVAVRKINSGEKVVVVGKKNTYVIEQDLDEKKQKTAGEKNVIIMSIGGPFDIYEEQYQDLHGLPQVIKVLLADSNKHNRKMILDEAGDFYAEIVTAMKNDAQFAKAEQEIFEKQLEIEMEFVAGFLNDKYFLTNHPEEKKHFQKFIFEEIHKKK